jgi:hypothetical protein
VVNEVLESEGDDELRVSLEVELLAAELEVVLLPVPGITGPGAVGNDVGAEVSMETVAVIEDRVVDTSELVEVAPVKLLYRQLH